MTKKTLALLGVSLMILAGCGATKGDAPEPTGSSILDGTNTKVIRMPDGFRNVAFSCFGTTGVYVTSRGVAETDPQPSGIAVLPNDPNCS